MDQIYKSRLGCFRQGCRSEVSSLKKYSSLFFTDAQPVDQEFDFHGEQQGCEQQKAAGHLFVPVTDLLVAYEAQKKREDGQKSAGLGIDQFFVFLKHGAI